MKYQLVSEWKEKAEVSRLCDIFDVSRSGFYAAKLREKASVICSKTIHLKAEFARSGKCYGSRRLMAALQAKGVRIGRYKVRRLMRQAQLRPVWKRQFVNTTDSKHNLPVAGNILDRQFNPSHPDRAWTSDITYIRTRTGWLYLAVVMDLFSRKIIGWAMSPAMSADLVCRALKMAIGARQPAPGLLMHSDRGSQYASHEYQNLLKKYELICSMSRKGNCWDNAAMERFFLNLKMERVWRRDYANQMEAAKDITEYIVGFYNCLRLHSTLGNLSPMIYEKKHALKKPIEVSENT